MSVHRPKRASARRSDGTTAVRSSATSSGPPKPPKWKEVVGDQPDAAFVAYNSTSTYAKDALVNHSKFGKGIVLEVDGNKVQILFEEGVRKLLHGTPS